MDTHDPARLALTLTADRQTCDGAWWPRSRDLGLEVCSLFETWPAELGLISRVYYCPLDWDDAPVAVAIPKRRGRLRMGHLPSQDTHHVVLGMLDGKRRTLVVLPSTTSEQTAVPYLRAFGRLPDGAPPVTGPRV